VDDAEEGDTLEMDLEKGIIINQNKGKTYKIERSPSLSRK
jgi:hypothetical protein